MELWECGVLGSSVRGGYWGVGSAVDGSHGPLHGPTICANASSALFETCTWQQSCGRRAVASRVLDSWSPSTISTRTSDSSYAVFGVGVRADVVTAGDVGTGGGVGSSCEPTSLKPPSPPPPPPPPPTPPPPPPTPPPLLPPSTRESSLLPPRSRSARLRIAFIVARSGAWRAIC